MTILAIGRGPEGTYNFLMADTTVDTASGKYEKPKVTGADGAFCCVVGDEQVRDSAVYLGFFHGPHRLDFAAQETAAACYEGATRRRMMYRAANKRFMPVTKTELFVVTSSDALYWSATFVDQGSGSYKTPTGPHHVGAGEILVFYAGFAPTKHQLIPDQNHWANQPIKLMEDAHGSQAAKAKLQLSRTVFCGVAVPHTSGEPLWHLPYATPMELWAREIPSLLKDANANSGLMKDPQFTRPLPTPKYR